MRKASVSILKAQLSQYLAAVKSGEEVIVTERGRAVARLVPVGSVESPEGRLAMLIREGRIKPPASRKKASLSPVKDLVKDPTGSALRSLLEERAEGR